MPDVPAGSNVVKGQGTNTLTFKLPGTPQYAIESVIATVDNGAGADTGAVLTMKDTDGTVIAKKRQGQDIDAGATTTATWALRLTDEAPATSGGLTVEQGFYIVGPTVVVPNNTSGLDVTYDSGVPLLNVTNPLQPKYLFNGLHLISAMVFLGSNPGKANKTAVFYVVAANVGYPFSYSVNASPLDSAALNPGMSGTSQWFATAGQTMDLEMTQDSASNLTFLGGMTVTRLS